MIFILKKLIEAFISKAYFGIILILLFLSCKTEEKQTTRQYLFLGHTYQWGVEDNNRIDFRLKDFDFGQYDQLWLGGDLCARSSEKMETLTYLDSIFDLSDPSTHWARGNHDLVKGIPGAIEQITKRNSYYSAALESATLVVMNTMEFHHPNYKPKPAECEMLDGQIQMLENIADTIAQSSHLIVLHHYCFLTNELYSDSTNLNTIFNLYVPDLKIDCANEHTFTSKLYPIFKKIQSKGVQVVLVSGDLGQRAKAFEYQTEDGIWFLGSGINNSAIEVYVPDYVTDTSPDKILVFEYDLEERELTWEFKELGAKR